MSAPHLVLVRGGLDDEPNPRPRFGDEPNPRPRFGDKPRPQFGGDSGAESNDDWLDFATRIGWSEPAPEPDDDFEEQLARRLFAARQMRSVELARELRGDRAEAHFDGDSNRGSRFAGADADWIRGVKTGAALVAVAAIVLFVASTLFTSGLARTVTASPEPSVEPALSATTAPEMERSLPIDRPREVERDRSRSEDEAPAPAPPRSREPRRVVKSPSSGARVAKRSPMGAAPNRNVARAAAMDAVEVDASPIDSRDLRSVGALTPASARRFDSPFAPPAFSTPSWMNERPTFASRNVVAAYPGPGSWTLPAASDRWLGVSVTPSAGSGEPPRLGVMAQLDLGKAFGKL